MMQVPVKVCGMTRGEDAALANELGADRLGFIFYAPSPRSISLEIYRSQDWPDLPKVAVDVVPSIEKVEALKEEGFDYFQLHAALNTDENQIRTWSELVGKDRLWLAPKLPPESPFPETWLKYADTFLVDTYTPAGFGGSGKVGDWSRYQDFKMNYRDHQWILAGGLSPDNVSEALSQVQPHRLDVNSGVESAPGIKDATKLRKLFEVLKAS